MPHVGDYWVFAARARRRAASRSSTRRRRAASATTTAASRSSRGRRLDGLPRALPARVRRRRTAATATSASRRRSHADGSLTIQDAIDQVKATGGKVCLRGRAPDRTESGSVGARAR